MTKTYSPFTTEPMPAKFGSWVVTTNGDLTHSNPQYYIEGSRIDEDDWILQVMAKSWIDLNTFIPAFFQATKNVGLNKISQKIHYHN